MERGKLIHEILKNKQITGFTFKKVNSARAGSVVTRRVAGEGCTPSSGGSLKTGLLGLAENMLAAVFSGTGSLKKTPHDCNMGGRGAAHRSWQALPEGKRWHAALSAKICSHSPCHNRAKDVGHVQVLVLTFRHTFLNSVDLLGREKCLALKIDHT